MDKQTDNIIATVALVYEIAPSPDGTVPTETRLLPAGYFRATDGRPKECSAWLLDATIAAQVIRRAQERKNDILIDYEHQSLHTDDNGQPAIAAGWIKAANLQWRESGLWAIGIDWTDKARAHIAAKELRYTSAVFTYYESTGEVIEIISATLTNSPALDDLDDLAALKRLTQLSRINQTKGSAMDKDLQIAALTVERDTAKTNLAALTQERDQLTTTVAALTKERDDQAAKLKALEDEKNQAALVAEQAECQGLIQAALKEGHVLPVVAPFLEKLNKADLTEYLTKTAGINTAILGKQHQANNQAAPVDLQDGEAIAQAATKYQAEQKALGLVVDDITAIQHVTKQTGR